MEELDLKELLQIFWSKKLQIILIIVIFMVVGLIYTLAFVTPKFQGYTTLLLATNSTTDASTSEITTTDLTINSKLVSTYSKLVGSSRIVRKVISNLGLDSSHENAIKQNIKVSAISNTEIIQITVENEDAALAAKIANEVAKVFIDTIKEFYGIENLNVVDEAEVQNTPSNINHTKDIAMFMAIGIVVAVMYVLIMNMLDTTIKSSQDIEKVSKLTVLASIPIYDMDEDRNKRKGGKR